MTPERCCLVLKLSFSSVRTIIIKKALSWASITSEHSLSSYRATMALHFWFCPPTHCSLPSYSMHFTKKQIMLVKKQLTLCFSCLGNSLPQFSIAETYQIHSSCLDNHPNMSKCRNQFHLYNVRHTDKDLSCTGSHLQKQTKNKLLSECKHFQWTLKGC